MSSEVGGCGRDYTSSSSIEIEVSQIKCVESHSPLTRFNWFPIPDTGFNRCGNENDSKFWLHYHISQTTREGTTYFLVKLRIDERRLGISGDTTGFSGKTLRPLLFPLTPENATALRARLPSPNPTPLGTRTSFGFGDRMGSATPGHIHALRAADPNGIIAPILAQQSVRENTRTGRTP